MDVRHRRQLALMLAPYLLGLVALVGIPALVTFGLALTEYDLIRDPTFVGLDNLRELWADEVFHTALLNSVVFAAIAVPLRRGGRARSGAAPPRALSGRRQRPVGRDSPDRRPGRRLRPALALAPEPALRADHALPRLARAARADDLGLPLPQFLTHPNDARAAIIILSIFTIGEGFVLLLVARQSLPGEVYELAAIEDATAWSVFRRVTLPLLAPILVLLFLRDTILSFQLSFVPALVVTEGGPRPTRRPISRSSSTERASSTSATATPPQRRC